MTAVFPDRTSISGTGPLVLFDGVCNFCSWTVQFLAPRDKSGSLWFASVQSRTGQELLRRHGFPTNDYESFLLFEHDRIYAKSRAFFRIAGYMCLPWPLPRAGLVLPQWLADWLYDRVAKNRYAIFGKKDICMIPRADISRRFLD
jgi:predicted DCC family thiol-disulfide oxidoreductase YuxK